MTLKHFWYSLKAGFLLTFLTFSSTAKAMNWTKYFYTDETHFYQRVHTDGFEQRFRVRKDVCHHFIRAEIVTKSTIYSQTAHFQQMSNSELAQWPSIYGLDEQAYCWFSARIKGLNLNQVEQNKYAIKFTDRFNRTSYYQAETNSLLPENRFRNTVTHWMTPGQMGATPIENGGTLFKVWEPKAEEVHLFINDEKRSVMKESAPFGTNERFHIYYAPEAKIGDTYHYQFVKDGEYEEVEVSNRGDFSPVKIDPNAREITYERKGGSLNAYLNPRGVIASPHIDHKWQYGHKIMALSDLDYDNWIIYQLWPLAFNPKEVNGRYQVGTFNDIAEKLDYIQDLGVNSIEFLPVHESRFNASWGYALDSLTLIEQSYGTRAELAKLIDQAHSRELKIILDVVINHINNFLIRDPLGPGINTSKFYNGDTDWGPRPNFENMMVQKWIAESLLNLARDYHVDGFRWDMIESIYANSSDGFRFLQEMNILLKRENPRFYSSAEQLPDNVWATYPISENGLGFDSQWNDKFKNFFELEFDNYRKNNRNIDMSPLVGSLMGYSNHRHWDGEYSFGPPSRVVNYLGSHDVVGNKDPILRIVSDFLSYETSGNNDFYRVRPLEEPHNTHARFRQIHNPFTHSVGMMGYGTLFLTPGASLFFQGEEFAQDINIENEWSYINAKNGNTIPTQDVDVDRFVRSHRVPWEYLDTRNSPELSFLTEEEHLLFEGYHKFVREMIHLRRNNPEINQDHAQEIRRHGNNIVSFKVGSCQHHYFIIINLGHEQEEAWIHFPECTRTWWNEVTNTMSSQYHTGDPKFQNIIPLKGNKQNLVRLGAGSFNIFTSSSRTSMRKDLYLMSSQTDWQADEAMKLRPSTNGELLRTDLTIDSTQDFEFKLADQKWNIEMGASPANINTLNMSGQVSYRPERPNIVMPLEKGRYRFVFNVITFEFTFIRL